MNFTTEKGRDMIQFINSITVANYDRAYSILERKNIDIDSRYVFPDNSNMFLLHYAAKSGSLEMCQILLDFRPDINIADARNKYYTALHYAVMVQNIEIIELLIARGADVNRLACLYAPIHFYVASGNAEIFKMLVNAGADINIRMGSSPVSNIRALAKIPPSNKFLGFTCINYAAYLNNLERVRFMIDVGADINIADEKGNLPIHYAVEHQNVEMVELLIKWGSYVDRTDAVHTPLHIAVYKSNLAICEMLILGGANVNSVISINRTPLHYAYMKTESDDPIKRQRVIDCLIKYGADMSISDSMGYIPFNCMGETHQSLEEKYMASFYR